MSSRYLLFIPLFISISSILLYQSCTENIPMEPGVDFDLAEMRRAKLKDVLYEIHFDIPEKKEDPIPAQTKISFTFNNTKTTVVLDFKEEQDHIQKVRANGIEVEFTHVHEHLIIPERYLENGSNEIEIAFIAGELSLNRNEEFLYTLLVPDRARTLVPIFDQPNLKAEYQLSLGIPLTWEAMANGALEKVDTLDQKKHYTFKRTKPFSTYIFAFTAGKFKKMTDPVSRMTMFYRETDSIKVIRNAPVVFELHRKSIEWLEDYTQIPMPFGKFDFALIPSFQYGGMEHPGAIFYRESTLFLDESASINQKLRRASLIAHETAHMWFGNLVTMDWFNDVWLKEVFANFMAAKIVNPSFPEVNHDLRFLLAHYPRALEIDRSEGSHPIQQPLANLQNAGTVYGAIIYQKAPIVMRNLEFIIGEDKFKEGIREYLTKFSYGNAVWDDLINIMKKHTNQNLDQWNADWVKKEGMPRISSSITDGEALSLKVDNVDGNRIWPQQLIYQLINNEEKEMLSLDFKEAKQDFPLVKQAENFVPNINGQGYGYFQLNEQQITYLLKEVANYENPIQRTAIWMMLWESLLHKNLEPNQLFSALVSNLPQERNPLLLDYMLDLTGSIFWKFFFPNERPQYAADLEDLLFEKMMSESDQSLKRSYYNAFVNVVTTTRGFEQMKYIWREAIPGFDLKLSEQDFIQLAQQIAVRGDSQGPQILKDQLDKIENPDSKKRMEFVLPALSPFPKERDTFFESLKNAENRSHEPWVNEALRYLHHPLRAFESEKYLSASLELLEEIQLTGDIFFPKRWLDNTLAGYQSPSAAKVVRQYLETHPDVSDNLRNKVLQSADLLFRAAERKEVSD